MIHESIYRLFRVSPISAQSIRVGSVSSFLFAPGVVLLGVGLAALLAPRLFIVLISGLFLLLGALFCLAAWKILQFKRSVDSFLKARVCVERVTPPVTEFIYKFEEPTIPDRKITFH